MGGGGDADGLSPWAGLQLNPQHYRLPPPPPPPSQYETPNPFSCRSVGSGLVNSLVAFVTRAAPPSPGAWTVPEWILKVRGLRFHICCEGWRSRVIDVAAGGEATREARRLRRRQRRWYHK